MMQLENTLVGGDFRVLRPLAQGGMGSVYVAVQQSTGQQRALKVMHPTLVQDPRLRERFEQEARVGARIPSHHVVQVIAAGVDRELGVPWIAMELLSGEDLGAHMNRRGAIPLGEIIPIFRQLSHALSAAHSVGIVHRDVKPENVFLANVQAADTQWQVKVLDFGIAKFMADAAQSATSQIGTPLWMAPEQSDASRRITPSADVWSLGLMAYRLLTGVYYWRSPNQENAPLSALFKELLIDPMVPASERAAEQGVSGLLPPAFDAWFARAVSRDPEARFQSISEAFSGFEALSGAPATAPIRAPSAPAITATSVPQPPPRSKSPWILIAVVLGLGLFAVFGILMVGFGAGAYFLTGRSAAKETAPASSSIASPEAPTAADPGGGTAPSSSESSSSGKKLVSIPGKPGPDAGPVVADTPKPATTEATTSSSGLKPIDVTATKKKVAANEAAATMDCAKFKDKAAAVESYTGSIGFRPDGTATGSMSGGGGSRDCVKDHMLNMHIGKYAHPQEWHVEDFPWSVTIK